MSVIGPRPQLVRDMVFMTDEQRLRHNSCVGYVAKCISIMKVNGVSVVVKEVGKWIKKRIQKY